MNDIHMDRDGMARWGGENGSYVDLPAEMERRRREMEAEAAAVSKEHGFIKVDESGAFVPLNEGLPSGIIQPHGVLTEQDAERIRKEWEGTVTHTWITLPDRGSSYVAQDAHDIEREHYLSAFAIAVGVGFVAGVVVTLVLGWLL